MATCSMDSHSEIRFSQQSELKKWITVNDTVMGGVSQSRVSIDKDNLRFSGLLSLRNNGGFASTRRVAPPLNWSSERRVFITVEGDGRRYQFRVRTNRGFDGVAYVVEFDTEAGQEQTMDFDLSEFSPRFRGWLIPDAPPLRFEDVSQVGFMLADKTPGAFDLRIRAVGQRD